MTLGCDLTLGPKQKTNWVILHPGKPGQILRNTKALLNVFKGHKEPVTQDIGGWIVMPPDHWEAVERALKEAKDN